MGNIIKLDPVLANQIAAGEVVERPVSVVKELLENSLDAGADSIKIEIENGGIDTIIISDNGYGIEKDDLMLVTEKHSTSKIKNLHDLQNVMTFGFRGEAIASIASVSDLEIISKHANNQEAYSFKNGNITKSARNSGTKIIMQELFSKTPARLHYLKKPRTEYVKIHEYIQSMALIYPEISFELIVDGKQIFLYRTHETQKNRIQMILGETFGSNLLTISSGITGLSLEGFSSDPKIHFQNKNKQFLYVNKRLIKSPMIYKAIADAYNRYIPHRTFPAYVLNVEIDPTQVDVNVHPRKQEIRFADESQIFRLVYHAIHEQLQSLSLITPLESSDTPEFSNTISEKITPEYYTGSGTKFKAYSPYKNTDVNPAQGKINDALNFSRVISSTQENMNSEHHFETSNDLHITKMGKIIGQAFNSYIIVETQGSLLILDQHALAERIIYEKLIQDAYIPQTQGLLLAESFNLDPKEFDIVERHTQALKDFGFELELLGNNILQILGIPDFIKKNDLRKVVEGIIADLSDSKIAKSYTLEEVRNKIAAYASCRSAIKFGHSLTLLEMNTLLNDAVTDYSATCPHGRPVISELDLDALKDMYDR